METQSETLKKEDVGYLKSALNLQQGVLVMTPSKLSLAASKSTVGLGLLGALLKKKTEKDSTIFDLGYGDIRSVKQGKHGAQSNVLEITDTKNTTHRIIVKNYKEWEDAIKQNM